MATNRLLKLLGAASFLVATARLIGLGRRRPHDPAQKYIKAGDADESSYEPREQERSKQAAPHHDANNRSSPGDESQQRYERRYWIVTGTTSVVATFATVAAACFAIGAYNASWEAVGAGRDQADTARKALLASDRPWLQVADFKVGRFQIDDQYVFIGTDLKLKNVGHSPALDIHIVPVLMPSLSVTEEASETIRICKEAKASSFNFYNSVVFPGEDRTYIPNETLFDLDIASIQKRKEARVREHLTQQRSMMGDGPAEAEARRVMGLPLRDGLTLLGCVTYKSATGGDVHATSFGVDLFRACPDGLLGMCAFEFPQPAIIPHDALVERRLLGASYAD